MLRSLVRRPRANVVLSCTDIVRIRLLALTAVVGIVLLSSSEWPHALGHASGHSRFQPVEILWQAYPLNPQWSRPRMLASPPTPVAQLRSQDLSPRSPDAGSPLRWFLPLAVVVGLLLLGAAVALIRAMDRLRPDPLQRQRAPERRSFAYRSLHRRRPAASENISSSLEERLMSYGHTPPRQAVDEPHAPEPEDAAGEELTEAGEPIEAGAQNARQRAEKVPKEIDDVNRLPAPREPPTLYRMPTILELAQHADVSAENVLRVVKGEPVSSAVAERVHRAIDELGPPYPQAAPGAGQLEATLDRTSQQLLDTLAETAAELEAKLPEGVGSIVYEALRVEVRPVTTQLSQMAELVQALLEHVRHTEMELQRERKERLDDVALITELITTGWRSVDRSLGRLERMLEDLRSADDAERQATRYVYLDKPSPPSE
jgi:hypothetical protein